MHSLYLITGANWRTPCRLLPTLMMASDNEAETLDHGLTNRLIMYLNLIFVYNILVAIHVEIARII